MSGSTRVTGEPYIPSNPLTVRAYVKVARIKMADASTITVVSSSSADVVGAGEDGTRVRTDDTKLNVVADANRDVRAD